MAEHPASATTLSLHPGDKIGAYVVAEVVARGGTGTVYKAHDPLLDRHVAIKHVLLSDSIDADRLRERVRKEAAIQKRVATASPSHLVQFIDTLDDPRGLMLVSEYVDGMTLEDRLQVRSDPHDERGALGIVAASAKALSDLHGAGVVHRDLKPANIMLPRKGGLKLADFGLAALVGDQESLSLGTVRYMSPELLRGDPATPACDLYSLGMIAYELLAGRERFDLAFKTVLRDRRNPAMRWMKWHTNDRLTAPPLTELVPGTPETLSDLVARMMDKDVARRIRGADDVVDAIRRHFIEHRDAKTSEPDIPAVPVPEENTGPSADAPSVSTPGDTARLPTKSRLPVILASLLVFWVVVGGVIWFVSERQAAQAQREEYEAARDQFALAKRQVLDGDYVAALTGFEAVRNGWPNDTKAVQAAFAWSGFTEGRVAEAEGRYGEALEAYRAFDGSPAGDRNLVRPLIETVQRKAGFSAALEEIAALVSENEYQAGRMKIAQWRAESLTESETGRLDAADAALHAGEARARVAVLLREAETFAEQGRLDDAIAVLEERSVLPPDGTALLNRLRAERDLDGALRDAREATRTGRLEDAITAYRLALELRDNAEVAEKLGQLEARQAVRIGARLLDEGKLAEAAAQFDTALLKDPANADAQRYRKQLVSVTEVQSLLLAGDTALETGDFAGAVAQYSRAYSLDGLEVIERKLKEAQRRLAMETARRALSSGNLEEATAQADLAEQLAGDHAELPPLREQIAVSQAYADKLAAAEERRAEGDYKLAIRRLQEAREILDTPDVVQRISETQYTWSLAKARDHLANGLLKPAQAELEIAARIDYTDEVQELLEEVRREAGQADDTP